MTPIETAAARLVRAEKELTEAAEELRRLTQTSRAAARRVLVKPSARRSWKEADEMARTVRIFKASNPRMTQAEIGLHHGLSRCSVAYYLGSKCKCG